VEVGQGKTQGNPCCHNETSFSTCQSGWVLGLLAVVHALEVGWRRGKTPSLRLSSSLASETVLFHRDTFFVGDRGQREKEGERNNGRTVPEKQIEFPSNCHLHQYSNRNSKRPAPGSIILPLIGRIPSGVRTKKKKCSSTLSPTNNQVHQRVWHLTRSTVLGETHNEGKTGSRIASLIRLEGGVERRDNESKVGQSFFWLHFVLPLVEEEKETRSKKSAMPKDNAYSFHILLTWH